MLRPDDPGQIPRHLEFGSVSNSWQINTLHFWLQNGLDSGAFRGSQAQWDKIIVPMLSVGNWSGMALHLRGNTEAFMRAASPHKKLRIHAGTHVHPFYSEDGRRDQLRFFDYWLKGIENGVKGEPPVKLAIRKGHDEIEWRYEHEWPLKRTQWTRFYLDLSSCKSNADPGVLADGNPAVAGACSYPATALGSMGSTSAASSQVMGGGIAPGMGVSLATPPLPHDIEVTGPVAAVLWVSSSTEDMDLFLTIRNIDGDGKEVLETTARHAGAGCMGYTGVASRARPAPVFTVSAITSTSMAVPRAWRDRAVEDLADLDGVPKGYRIRLTSARDGAAAPPTCITKPITIAAPIPSMPAESANPICCCRSFRLPRRDSIIMSVSSFAC